MNQRPQDGNSGLQYQGTKLGHRQLYPDGDDKDENHNREQMGPRIKFSNLQWLLPVC